MMNHQDPELKSIMKSFKQTITVVSTANNFMYQLWDYFRCPRWTVVVVADTSEDRHFALSALN